MCIVDLFIVYGTQHHSTFNRKQMASSVINQQEQRAMGNVQRFVGLIWECEKLVLRAVWHFEAYGSF